MSLDRATTERRLSGTVKLRELVGADDDSALGVREVEILAYTGAPVDVGFGQEIFDLGGLRAPTQEIPLLLFHDDTRIAGFSTSVENTGEALKILGKVFVNEEDGGMVASRSDLGFPWQASIRVAVTVDEHVMADAEPRTINGRELAGPFWHDKEAFSRR